MAKSMAPWRRMGAPAYVPGVLCALTLATVATLLAPYAPILGAPVIAIVAGVAVRALGPLPPRADPGLAYAARSVLQAAIVLSGFAISLGDIWTTGLRTLPVTLGTIAVAFLIAPFAGRALRLDVKLRELVGIGTAICGASAIAAVSSVIEPAEAEVALAVATIFFYNIAAVLIFPLVGHALHLTQDQFGVWAGTAINDTSSVVAAGFAYGHAAGVRATIVKLTRAMLIVPIVGALALTRARREHVAGRTIPWRTIVPWFILWFVCAAFVNSAGFVPAAWHAAIGAVATFAISTALAAIGLRTALPVLFGTGWRPLALGFILWTAVALASLAIQHLTGL